MKNRYKTAVGLEYDDSSQKAPTLSLKGEHLLADEIVKAAKRFGVPVVEDPELARVLKATPERGEIPEGLYQAVAIVLNNIENGCRRVGNFIGLEKKANPKK